MRIDVANYQRTVGDELRRARKQHGWTRKELQERLNNEVSWQTLATYELGTRQCSVARFAELCAALDEQPYALLERVHQRLYPKDVPPDAVRITLGTIIDDDQPELLPLRRWAHGRIGSSLGGRAHEIRLALPALERLAELCELETVELIRRLRGLQSVG